MTISELIDICEKECIRGKRLLGKSDFDDGYFHAFRLCLSLIKSLNESYDNFEEKLKESEECINEYKVLVSNILKDCDISSSCLLCKYEERGGYDTPCHECFGHNHYLFKYENIIKNLFESEGNENA